MNKIPLLILLWAVSCIRAMLIVGCLLALYFVGWAILAPENSTDINVYFPAVIGSFLFICILMKDATWVEKKKEKLSSL